MARAHEIGMHRVAAGVHYPSDVEAGNRYAAFIYDKMSKSPQYKTELATATAEINAAFLKAQTPPPPPPPAPVAPSAPLPPVDCMHPQPGELQTKCQ